MQNTVSLEGIQMSAILAENPPQSTCLWAQDVLQSVSVYLSGVTGINREYVLVPRPEMSLNLSNNNGSIALSFLNAYSLPSPAGGAVLPGSISSARRWSCPPAAGPWEETLPILGTHRHQAGCGVP